MNPIKKLFDNIHPYVEEGGKFHAFRSLVDGFETFAFVPNTTSRVGSVNIHDAIDSKRIMSFVVIALLPALFFGMYNVGYQNALAAGQLADATFWGMFWYGFLAVLPKIIVSYVVGLGIEFTVAQWKNEEIQEGFLVSGIIIPMIVPANMAVGDYEVTISNIRVNGEDITTPVQFVVKVVERHSVTLDENSTTLPEDATGVNVTVNRSFASGVWSTICLPFAMSTEQVKAAFGDEVKIGDFNGYETTEEGENLVGITVNFAEVYAIEANHPYIVKPSMAVNGGFTVESVSINGVEDYPELKKGTSKKYKTFTGTNVAGDVDVENSLFLNGGKFYYTTGNTKYIKAFRGYFDFYEILTSIEEGAAGARMKIDFNGNTTAVGTVKLSPAQTGIYYNLQGIATDSPKKGLSIKNGKKVMVK